MRKALKLTLALAALAAAGTGMLSPKRAEAACFRYCCPDLADPVHHLLQPQVRPQLPVSPSLFYS